MSKPLKSADQLTPEARELINSNLGLIPCAARKLRATNLSFPERLSACGMALLYAARTFRPGGKFHAHYFQWARSVLAEDRALMYDWPVHIPKHERNRRRKEANHTDDHPISSL